MDTNKINVLLLKVFELSKGEVELSCAISSAKISASNEADLKDMQELGVLYRSEINGNASTNLKRVYYETHFRWDK
jgi:hypothetical protein